MKAEAFSTVYRGSNGLYGVSQGGAVLYEPDFEKATAKRICELEDSDDPPIDWMETRKILKREGFQL